MTLLFVILLVCYLAVFAPVAQATTIDITPQQVPGETIPVETKVGAGGAVEGSIGPKANKVQFPILNLQKKLFSDTILQNRTLPAKLIQQLKFPTPSPDVLQGQLGHVTCGKATIIKKVPKEKKFINEAGEEIIIIDGYKDVPLEDNNVYIESKPVGFSATKDYEGLLAPTRFWQSIFLPKKGTDLSFDFKKNDASPLPTRLIDCGPEPKGAKLEEVKTANEGPNSFNPIAGIVSTIEEFFRNILGGQNSATLNAQSKQIKLLPGEAVLKDQTVGDNGFLNFFKPAKAQFSKTGDQESPVAYEAGNRKDAQEEITYAGVASLKGGSEDLVKSLYPAKLASRINLGDIIQLPPSPRESGGLTYTIPYRDSSISISQTKKDEIIKLVRSNPEWPDTKIAFYWDKIVTDSIVAGINPALSLALWIEESGASHYSNHFSCPPEETNFDASFKCYIKTTLSINPANFETWAKTYCGEPAPGYAICTINAAGHNNSNFLKNLKIWYGQLVPPGSPGESTPLQ